MNKIKTLSVKFKKPLIIAIGIILILSTFLFIFQTQKAKAAWYSASWNYRQKIIIDHNKVPNTDQTDFPVLIKITDANNAIFTKAQADGDDLLFTSSNETTKLSHEIEKFTVTEGNRELIAWVKIPTLSHTTDTTIYLYYGNPSTSSGQAPADVWSNGYAGVWHLGEASGTFYDATSNNNDGTDNVDSTDYMGKIGNGQLFSGNDYIMVGSGIGKPANWTISTWIRPGDHTYGGLIVSSDVWSNSRETWGIYLGTEYVTVYVSNGSTQQTFAVETWNQVNYPLGVFTLVTAVVDGVNVSYYRNGAFIGSTPQTVAMAGTAFPLALGRFGQNGDVAYGFVGNMDEPHISSTARSADWIATEYANQNSPETFIHINGEVGKDNYTIPTQPAGWYAPDWAKRQPITINHALVPNTDQTDFPTLIKLTDVSNDLWANAQADGDDILFADASGNKLAHELESFSTSSKYMWAWVKIPTLSHTVDTVIYMHYANPNAPNQQSKTAVWSNGYAGVWHLPNGTTLTANDSTSNVNNGTLSGTPPPSATTGQIDGVASFDGSHSYIATSVAATPAADFNLSAWVNKTTNAYMDVITQWASGQAGRLEFGLDSNSTGKVALYIGGEPRAISSSAVPNGWHLISVKRVSGAITLYVDNESVGTGNNSDSIYQTTTRFGTYSSGAFWNSTIDEIRISSTARSADWIATEYANQNDPESFESFGAMENPDTFDPTNPTVITALYSAGGSPILLNAGSDSTPYYSWPEPEAVGGASDATGAYISGVAGYYSYFDTSCGGGGADPEISRGVLSDTGGGLHYSTDTNISVPDLTTNEGDYCFRIKTRDNAGNVSAVTEVATYTYDITNPNAPLFIAVNPAGYSSVDSFDFTWPVATDNVGGSGIAGYQYKRGNGVDDWSATQVETSVSGITSYLTGENIFLVRSVDNAGNYSSSVQTTYYYSNEVPTKPTGVTAIPALSDTNSFAFSWTAPVLDPPGRPIVDYGYVINAVPTLTNLTWRGNPSTTLGASPFATAQGVNTFYIVAKDDSGAYGIAVANYGSVTFNCTTVAPPIPIELSITDSSNHTIPLWALTIKWTAGVGQTTPPFDHYAIERSTDGVTFAPLATTAGTAYIDANGLNNTTTYYYQIKSVDNAGATSAASSIVSKMPTGKYATPPTIVTGPNVSIQSTDVTITWTTNRASSSYVRFGTKDGEFTDSKGQFDSVTDHSVNLNGLQPSTKYYYQVQSLDEYRDYSAESAFSPTFNFTTLAAPAISDVSVGNITLNSADVSWDTTTIAATTIYYGTTMDYGSSLSDGSGSGTTKHSVTLTGLTDTTVYNFKIRGTDVDANALESDNYVFQTLPMPKIENIAYEQDYTSPKPAMIITWTSNVPITSSISYRPQNGTVSYEESQSALIINHKITISNLSDSTTYRFTISGRDQFGNLAISDEQVLNTALDTRPPKISKITIETSIIGSGSDSKGQAVVSWETDEPATSAVEYAEGVIGDKYVGSSQDEAMVTFHTAVISDLKPSSPYHLRVVSKDKGNNTATSEDNSIIIQKGKKGVWQIIIEALQNAFGFLSKAFK